MVVALRGEVWVADLNPTRGHEQAGSRPVLVISDDLFNRGPADLIIVLPITSVPRGIPSHVKVKPPEGGLKKESYVMTEAIRSISKERLTKKLGRLSVRTVNEIEDCLQILLCL